MTTITLLKGMKVFGESEDVEMSVRIETAVEEWGHLAVFYPEDREHLAVYLGIAPRYNRYAAAWRAYGKPAQELSSVGVAYAAARQTFCVSENGTCGGLLAQMLMETSIPVDCLVIGDHVNTYTGPIESFVTVTQPLTMDDLAVLMGDDGVEPEDQTVHDKSSLVDRDDMDCFGGVRDAVDVAGDGLMDSVILEQQHDGLSAFLRDMIAGGLSVEAAQSLLTQVGSLNASRLSESVMNNGTVGVGNRFEGGVGSSELQVVAMMGDDVVVRKPALARSSSHEYCQGGYRSSRSRKQMLEYAAGQGDATAKLLLGRIVSDETKDVGTAGVGGTCHRAITTSSVADGPVSWSQLMMSDLLKPDRDLAAYSADLVEFGRWHIELGGTGVNVLAIVKSLRAAVASGLPAVVAGGCVVRVDDCVGVHTRLSALLVERVSNGGENTAVLLDKMGARLLARPVGSMTPVEAEKFHRLEYLGQSVLSMAVATRCWQVGLSPDVYHNRTFSTLTDDGLSDAMRSSRYCQVLDWYDTSRYEDSDTASLVKVVVAVLYNVLGLAFVHKFLDDIGLVGDGM